MIRLARRTVAVLLFCVAAAATATWYLGRLADSRAWTDRVRIEKSGSSSGRLLEAAVRTGVVRFEPIPGRIAVAPCEVLEDPGIEGAPTGPDAGVVLETLCRGSAGRGLLDEIEAWNRSFLTLAVRDDRDGGPTCDDGRPLPVAVVLHGCRAARWTAAVSTPSGAWSDVAVDRAAAPSPRDFVALARSRGAAASDWAMVPPTVGDAGDVLLTTVLATGRPVTVDLVGDPVTLTVGRDQVDLAALVAGGRFAAGGVRGTVEPVCDAAGGAGGCAAAREGGLPRAVRLTLAPADADPVEIAVVAGRIENRPAALRAVLAGTPGARAVVDRTPHLRLACVTDRGAPLCELGWRLAEASETMRRHGHALTAADGTALLDDRGRATAATVALGLAPFVGWGPADPGSLAAALAAAARTRDRAVGLTVDPRLQAAARDALDAAMEERIRTGRSDPATKAALVLLDADVAPGDVLAVAGTPAFAGGVNQWDVEALAAGGGADDPLAGHAWRAGDVDAMPGSTFKLATALAGLDAAGTDDEVWAVWTGAAPVEAVARRFGLASPADGALVVDGPEPALNFTVNNAEGSHSFGADDLPPGDTGCPAAGSRTRQLGVCEALIRSSNLWFAGLELMLDGPAVVGADGRESAAPTPDLRLARTLGRLYPVRDVSAAGPSGTGVDLARGALPGAYRLVAEPIRLSAVEPNGARRIALATNGYGQGVTMTPLAVASLYASVATGRVVLPRIVPASDPHAVADPREGLPLFAGPGDETRRRDGLARIRAGLRGVAATGVGTARRVFEGRRDLARRVSSKTGTATTRADGVYSAWYAGWVEPAPGSGIDRRMVFVCWITGSTDYGAGACGPVVRRLLEALDEPRGSDG